MGPGLSESIASAVAAVLVVIAVTAFGLGFLVHYVFF
jgi:hypothetical protein